MIVTPAPSVTWLLQPRNVSSFILFISMGRSMSFTTGLRTSLKSRGQFKGSKSKKQQEKNDQEEEEYCMKKAMKYVKMKLCLSNKVTVYRLL
jgi:hypothetical protein